VAIYLSICSPTRVAGARARMATHIKATQLLLASLCFAAAYPSGGSEFGLAFLAANKAKPGVVELPSGLQYKVLVSGEGKDHPSKDSPCACMAQALSQWCHSLLPRPPGADSHRTWLRNNAPGRANEPIGPIGSAALRPPSESRRSCCGV
jgi:hypothetical protein